MTDSVTDSSPFEKQLRELRNELTQRIDAIHKDTHHTEEPVEKDFAEQATQSENDDVLNALDHEAKATLNQVDHALKKIADGQYGLCESCGQPIRPERLQAIPYASLCINCAENG